VLRKESHLAMVLGEIDGNKPTLLRVHSECLTGDVFHSLRCDCGEQLETAMAIIALFRSGPRKDAIAMARMSGGKARTFGLDRSGPEPQATRAGQPLRPFTLPNLIGYARIALLAAFLVIALGSDDGRVPIATVCFAAAPSAFAYGWPLKPFHKAHPIRGNFGDPRTVFTDPFDPTGLAQVARDITANSGNGGSESSAWHWAWRSR